MLDEQLRGPDADLVEDTHRDRQRQHRHNVRRRDDGGNDKSDHHEIATKLFQLLDANQAHAGNHDDRDRHLEGSAEGDEHRQHEAEVGLDVRRGGDALGREPLNELEDLAEDEKVVEEAFTRVVSTGGSK